MRLVAAERPHASIWFSSDFVDHGEVFPRSSFSKAAIQADELERRSASRFNRRGQLQRIGGAQRMNSKQTFGA